MATEKEKKVENAAEAPKAPEVNEEKMKALQATIDKIRKDFGKGTIMKLGDQPVWDEAVIPSGSIGLDHVLKGAARSRRDGSKGAVRRSVSCSASQQ